MSCHNTLTPTWSQLTTKHWCDHVQAFVFKVATSRLGLIFSSWKSSPSSTILSPVWFIITCLVFFYLNKRLFWGFLQFEGDLIWHSSFNSMFTNAVTFSDHDIVAIEENLVAKMLVKMHFFWWFNMSTDTLCTCRFFMPDSQIRTTRCSLMNNM